MGLGLWIILVVVLAGAVVLLAGSFVVCLGWRRPQGAAHAVRVELRLPLRLAVAVVQWSEAGPSLSARLLGIRLRFPRRRRRRERAPFKRAQPPPRKQHWAFPLSGERGAPARSLIREGVGALADLFGCVRLRKAEGDITFGAEDPATTGMLFGWAMAALAENRAISLAVQPDFERPGVFGQAEAELGVVSWRVVKVGAVRGVRALRKGGLQLLWRKLRRKRSAPELAAVGS